MRSLLRGLSAGCLAALLAAAAPRVAAQPVDWPPTWRVRIAASLERPLALEIAEGLARDGWIGADVHPAGEGRLDVVLGPTFTKPSDAERLLNALRRAGFVGFDLVSLESAASSREARDAAP